MDSILFWNDVSLEAVARDHTGIHHRAILGIRWRATVGYAPSPVQSDCSSHC
jgi:hypothetical protein